MSSTASESLGGSSSRAAKRSSNTQSLVENGHCVVRNKSNKNCQLTDRGDHILHQSRSGLFEVFRQWATKAITQQFEGRTSYLM